MVRKSLIILLSILIVATILRVYQLDKVPPSLFGDEVDVGYQAYSLLKTGQDLYGQPFPTLIHSLSEYRAPLFIYSDIPFIAIFGLNEWGVRMAAAFWGVLGILGIFLLARKLFSEKLGLLAAGLLAISPWHIHYSRAGFEVIMLLSFFIFAVYFFLKSLEKKWYLVISAILFGLTPYIYSTAAAFMPLLILILLLLYGKKIFNYKFIFIISIIVFIVILTPYLLQTFSGKAGERFNIISIFGSKDLTDKVLLYQKSEQLPADLQRFFHNKPLIWMQNITLNYLRAYSPEFLFLNGDPNSRHSIHEMGEMYYFEIFLLGLGILELLGRLGKENRLILGWFLISPIPAALTFDGGFHATRNFLMVFPLMIIIAFGTNKILENLKNIRFKYLAGFLIFLAIFNFVFFLHRYFVEYPKESWRAWHFGFKESMQYIGANSLNYEKILINNTYEPSLIRFLFWTKYDPNKFHQKFSGDKILKNITNGFDGFTLDNEQSSSSNKIYFGKIDGPVEQILDKNTLFVASGRDDITNPAILSDSRLKLLDTIYSPTSEPVFYILIGQK